MTRTSQTAIPCLCMRGGDSKWPFFKGNDLPPDMATRGKLLAIMGSPDKRQIDGLGSAHPVTSKVGFMRPGTEPGFDLDLVFAVPLPDGGADDTTPNCDNMLAPVALEVSTAPPRSDGSTFRVLMRRQR